MIGQTVGNFRVAKLLAEGGMGSVYLAEHPRIGRKAAIKVLHPDLSKDRRMLERFFNEARAANAIRHPGIVEIFDSGTLPGDPGAPYIIMEFLEGQSLATRLRQDGRIGAAHAVDLVIQTASAVGAAHAAGITHRDLKPDNLFLVTTPAKPPRDVVKVLDFGIAKLGAGFLTAGSVKTQAGSVMGTPLYMSPEQCRGTIELDSRTDIYSLGVILYEMVCGVPPFVSEGFGEIAHLHISAAPAPPRSHCAGISVELEDVIMTMLAKERTARFQDMATLQAALHRLSPRPLPVEDASSSRRVSNVAGRNTTISDGVWTRARSFLDRRPWRLLVGVAGVTLLIVAVLSAIGRKHPPPPTKESSAVPLTAARAARIEKMVVLEITSEPKGARVVRDADGAVIGVTPFKGSRLASGGIERVTLTLDGFTPEPLSVPLDRDVNLTFALKRDSAIQTALPKRRATSTRLDLVDPWADETGPVRAAAKPSGVVNELDHSRDLRKPPPSPKVEQPADPSPPKPRAKAEPVPL